jgi:DNA-binding MarR family transcriptional regulator
MTATPQKTEAENLLRLEHQVCFALNNATRAFGAIYRDALKDLGLTYPQYLAMMALWEHEELSVKRLGELLRLDSGTLSPLLKRLESAGLVRRERSPQDERSVLVSATPAGVALREQAAAVPAEVAARAGLDVEELRQLRGMLGRLTDRLDAAGTSGPTQEG